jgi:hypothetical protein
MLSCDLKKLVAVALVFTTVLVTLPVSAADFSSRKSVLGSVSAVGPVELRGVGISQEGTLFAGDRIRAGQKGYAKVLLGTGSKIELAEETDVNIDRDGQGVKIAMNGGTLGFTAMNPLRIDVMPFEVTATDGAAGNVAIMRSGTAGIRAVNGKVTVRNLKTSESFVLIKGQERLLGLQNGAHSPSLAEIASNVPGPIPAPVPAPVPQAPAGRSGGLAMDTGAWLAVIGGAAVAGIAIWGLVVALNNRDDIKELKSSVDNLNNTVAANNAATQAAIRNISNATALANNVSQLQSQQNQVAVLAAQAQLALQVAGNTTAANQAATIAAAAAASQTRLIGLQGAIQAAQADFAAGRGSAATLNTLIQQEATERATANANATSLNTLLANNRTTPGVPQATVSAVGAPRIASASVPV